MPGTNIRYGTEKKDVGDDHQLGGLLADPDLIKSSQVKIVKRSHHRVKRSKKRKKMRGKSGIEKTRKRSFEIMNLFKFKTNRSVDIHKLQIKFC